MNLRLYLVLCGYVLCLYGLTLYIKCTSLLEYLTHFLEDSLDESSYDYIIVGCGTAGSLIAHHLSARNVSFLALEAGGSGGPLIHPPSLGVALHKSTYDWQYKTVPQKNACFGLNNKESSWTQGKILGGSAKLNNMVHIRGYLNEIVSWFGDKYNSDILEKFLIDLEVTDLPYNKIVYKTHFGTAVLNAGVEIGYDIIDSSVNSKIGFMEPVFNQVNGARWTTSHTLLNFHLSSNSRILTNSFVHKIIFGSDKYQVAKGVLFERFGKFTSIYAKKGIILSAGTVGSPKLLLLSGIGPKQHLTNINIPIISDLPVGENLMDHVTTGLDLITLKHPVDFTIESFINPFNAWRYLVYGEGPWTFPGCEMLAFINTKNLTNSNDKPDLQLMIIPLALSSDHGLLSKDLLGIKDNVWINYLSKLVFENAVTILPVLLHPKSKGKVYLSSNDPYELPLIDPNYLAESEDIEVLLKGIDLIKKLLETKSLREIGARLNTIPFPGCEENEFDSREYWVCYIRHLTLTAYHPAGTCKMGPENDDTSVVNYDFSVKGVSNLYVVDASVFPTLLSGNINTGVALLAKIFSEVVLNNK